MTQKEKELRKEAHDWMKKNMAPWDWEEEYDNDQYDTDATLEEMADFIDEYFEDQAPAELVDRLRNFKED